MRRVVTFSLSVLLLAGLVLVGCDISGNKGNKDFSADPGITIFQNSVQLTVPGGAQSSDTATVEINYAKLDGEPSVETTSEALTVEKTGEGRSEPYQSQVYNVFYAASVGDVIQDSILVSGSGNGNQFADTLTANISPGFISTDFSSGYVTIADYEDTQRDSSASGGTSITLVQNQNDENDPVGSNGVHYLEVDASGSGAVTFERRVSAPNSDRFTFLTKPSPDTDFTLTITFTEETGGGTTTRSVDLPISSADQWRKFTVEFDQLGDFNPVATRAGGNGPLTKVEFSANKNVTYLADQLMLGTENTAQAEIMDFERTTGAYGPPFCPPTFSKSNMVAVDSDGFTSRSVEGGGCFGYNYGGGLGPPALLFLDVTGSDVLSIKANATPGDSLEMFVETIDGDGDGTNDGAYNTDNSKTVPLPVNQWGTVEVRLDSLGNDPTALQSPGIRNVGFTARGDSPDILIDDIKIRAPSGN